MREVTENAHTPADMDGSHFPLLIGDRHTEQGSLCVLGRRRSGRNCCAHPPPATRRLEWESAGFRPSPAATCSTSTTRPRSASEALSPLHIVSHSASVPARPAKALSRVAPARLIRAFSGPVTVLP